MTNQDNLREKVRFLKWHYGLDYKNIALAIGMTDNAFYNFISGSKYNLSHKKIWLLENYIKEVNDNGTMGI